MQVKTSELNGNALDWAVAKCLNITPIAVKKKYSEGYILYSLPASTVPLEYSSKWAQGGPIIDRECIWLTHHDAAKMHGAHKGDDVWFQKGSTPLIAAMRCYVASKFGGTVEIPDQFLEVNL